eukprot:1192314-Prorocentrum_minimum.AAC.1
MHIVIFYICLLPYRIVDRSTISFATHSTSSFRTAYLGGLLLFSLFESSGGIQPDIVMLDDEGWPETADPPEGPVTFWVSSQEGVRRAVRVRVGELACTSDLLSHTSSH